MADTKKVLKFIFTKGMLFWGLITALAFVIFFPALFWVVQFIEHDPASYFAFRENSRSRIHNFPLAAFAGEQRFDFNYKKPNGKNNKLLNG